MEHPKRILVVDDEEQVRELLARMLNSLGYEVETAGEGIEALAKMELDIDLVMLDIEMPGMDGYEVARRIRGCPESKEIPIVMVTCLTTHEDRIRSVEAGANDFIAKPFDITEIKLRTDSQLKAKEAYDQLKRHKAELEKIVARRTASLRRALEEVVMAQRRLQEAHLETINRLVVAAEYKDRGSAAHVQRMSRFCAMLARRINLPPGEVQLILYASPMHDIGKIGIPEEILLKPAKLTEKEWIVMKQHPMIGAEILKNSSSDLLRAGEIIALGHHEKWDGSGYPNGFGGEDIHIWNRISTVSDVFDALTSVRPYKKAYSNKRALEVMWEGKGKTYDPRLIDVLVNNMDEVVRIQKEVNGNRALAM